MVLNDLSKLYADVLIFQNITASVAHRDRIGLVGENGAGKTTLLNVMAGQEHYDEGKLSYPRNYRIGYLEQTVADRTLTLFTYLEQAFAELRLTETSMKQAERDLTRPEVYEDEQRLQQTMYHYANLQQQWEELGGYDYPSRIRHAAYGLGFAADELEKPLGAFSGGQQIRAKLARLLLEQPDLLLLDEPTNHLDIAAIEWLEGYFQGYPKAIVVVSHDRFFLDKVATRIWELRNHQLIQYKGDYTSYVTQRDMRVRQQEEEAKRHQEEVLRIEEFIRRNHAGNRSRQAKSLEKKLLKMDSVEGPVASSSLQFTFHPRRSSGERVATLQDIGKTYDRCVITGVNAQIRRGDRIGVIGPNGSGKTTLLRILAGEINHEGTVRWGTGVEVGYFSQDLAFEHQGTVLDELYETFGLDIGPLRSVLARFLFRGDDVFKPISVLSGGERNRLALAKLLLRAPNLLLLDEPTNHLDIYARDGLEEALNEFGGTYVFVSHDRYFINRLANKLWILGDNAVTVFRGTYQEYQEKKKEEAITAQAAKERAQPIKPMKSKASSGARPNVEKKLFAIEQRIMELEEEKTRLEAILGNVEVYQDAERSKTMVSNYREIERQLDCYYQQWEALDR